MVYEAIPRLGRFGKIRGPMYPRAYLYDGRHDPTRVRQPECDEQVDVYFVAQTPQLPGRQRRGKTILSWHLSFIVGHVCNVRACNNIHRGLFKATAGSDVSMGVRSPEG